MRATTAFAGLSLLVAGCTTNPPVLSPHLSGERAAAPVELSETPFFAQTRYQCGPAALATVLQASGAAASPETLRDEVYLPARRGSLQVEMLAASRARGRLPYVLSPALPALLAELQAGRPVLVLQNLGWRSLPYWHYAVVIGYDPQSDELILRSGVEPRRRVSATRFVKTWERAGAWGVVILRPGELPAEPQHGRFLQAAAALESAGQVAAARRAYQRALQAWPGSPLAWLGLGNAAHAQGDLEAAESAYRMLLGAARTHPVGRNNLAQVLAERGCHRSALREIEAGLEALAASSPLRSVLRDTRAEILARMHENPALPDACTVAVDGASRHSPTGTAPRAGARATSCGDCLAQVPCCDARPRGAPVVEPRLQPATR